MFAVLVVAITSDCRGAQHTVGLSVAREVSARSDVNLCVAFFVRLSFLQGR
jgi:hypothetical protein